MTTIEYFKLQAKNLFRDYKTKKPYIDDVDGNSYYKYESNYFDMGDIVCDFDVDEDDFSLMKAQHIVALMVGFRKWTDLLKASKAELDLAKLLFDNQDKISSEDWDIYIEIAEDQNKMAFSPEDKLELFKRVILEAEGHINPFADYRLKKPPYITKSLQT